VEYIPNEENKKKDSIFDEKIICPRKVHIYNETPIGREHAMDIEPNMHHYSKDYNLDEQPLDEKNNKNGLVGLNNLGNTCYMNTGLQCLSNCELLTKYILGNFYEKFINKENPIGSQGEIIEKYAQLIKHLWYGNRECISPIQFKKTFGKNYQAFNDYRQQDTQEFISYLLDSLHEDLNKVIKKPYIKIKDLSNNLSDEEMFEIKKNLYFCRNQSFICDLIYGFYKSTIYCPNIDCKNISKSFEPFNMITLSLINEIEQRKIEEYIEEKNKQLGFEELYVIFIPFKLNFKPLNFKIKIKNDIDIITFKKKVEIITGFCYNTFELYKIKDEEFFGLNKDINKLKDFLEKDKIIYLIQIPPYVFGKENNYFDKIYHKLNSNNDILFLEEEKYEGNDIYNLYNKKSEKKSEKEEKEEKKEEENINKIDIVYQEVINNNKPESEISTKNN
jgi:ubiquitin carboxyl-terminal hydrolase 4/11/15